MWRKLILRTKPHDTAFCGLKSGNIAVVVADDIDAKSGFVNPICILLEL